jgi:hypothetical protein
MITQKIVFTLISLVLCIPVIAFSQGIPAQIKALQKEDANLQNQINNIQLKPGPQGPQGPQGPAGPGLTNLDALTGLPCNNGSGTVLVSYGSQGTIMFRCVCAEGATRACYDGPVATRGVGPCHDGTQTCINGVWGSCQGQVLPQLEICNNHIDEDCNGIIDDCGQAKIVFLSSVVFDSNLGGLSGADAKCQSLAETAGLSGTYKAWLSTAIPGEDPFGRFTHSPNPYIRTDGKQIVANFDDLVSYQQLAVPINIDEFGNIVGPGLPGCPGCRVYVWTATQSNGSYFDTGSIYGSTCGDWTGFEVAVAIAGDYTATDYNWSQAYSVADCGGFCIENCRFGNQNRLYCFQQ